MKYTNISEIENYLLIEIHINFEPQIEKWINAIESFIDKITNRNFKADTIALASIRKYEVESERIDTLGDYKKLPNELSIDECVAVLELKIDGGLINSSNYILYPTNELPTTRIKLTDDSGLTFSEGEQNIEVKAQWGYSVECPVDINLAATILVAGIINYSLSTEGEVASESIGGYSVSYKTESQWQDLNRAKEILENYKKIII